MKFFEDKLTKGEIDRIKREFSDYIKVTADLEKKLIVVGCRLHADGEKILLKKGGRQEDIWGGGIDLKDKIIDTTAVLNIRPNLDNNNMEILDGDRREKFLGLVKKYFFELWQ